VAARGITAQVHQGKATLCGACGRRIKNLGVGLFCPSEVDRLYVNTGSLGKVITLYK
jgi:hypothetical protein